jgi:hypothetical protein
MFQYITYPTALSPKDLEDSPHKVSQIGKQNILIFATIVVKKIIAADCSQPQNKFSKG